MSVIDLAPLENKKIALVLSGGVVKAAAWHIGVSLALDELGFRFKCNLKEQDVIDQTTQVFPNPKLEVSTYVGSSAGTLVSCYLASGFSPQDIIDATLRIGNKKLKSVSYKDMLSLKSPIKRPPSNRSYNIFEGFPFAIKKILSPLSNFSGLFSTQGLHNYLLKNVLTSNDFNDYSSDLFIVATQLDHSRKVIFSKYNYPNPLHDSTAHYYTGTKIADAAAASMSVPPFYAPYPIKNKHKNQIDYYIDGEIRETLSTHVAIDNKCEYIISSWTHTPYHYHPEIGSLINYGLPAICIQAIYLLVQKKIISSRAKFATDQDIINTVSNYLKNEKFSEKHRKDILSILENKLNFKPNVKLIDIYPSHENFELFFSNPFSLNPKQSALFLKMAYKRTMKVFKEKEWER